MHAKLDLPDAPRGPLSWGVHGELEGVAACMIAGGVEGASFEALMGISATAWRTHFFRLSDNPGMRLGPDPETPNQIWGPRYAWTSLEHNNFGHHESLSHYFGGDVLVLEKIAWDALWKVLRFELDAGRPLVVSGLPGRQAHRATLVTGYTLTPRPMALTLHTHDDADDAVFTPRDGTPTCRWTLVRPGPCVDYRRSDEDCRQEAARWALRHMRNRRELVYETERFYAVSLQAFDAFAAFWTELVPAELSAPIVTEPDAVVDDLARFGHAVAAQWSQARRAAAGYARAWAETSRLDAEALRAYADAADQTAEAIGRVCALAPDPSSDPDVARAVIQDADTRANVARLIATARGLEEAAIARFAAAVEPA